MNTGYLLDPHHILQSPPDADHQSDGDPPGELLLALTALLCCALLLAARYRYLDPEFSPSSGRSVADELPDLSLPAAVSIAPKPSHRRHRSLDLLEAPGDTAEEWQCGTTGEVFRGLLTPEEVEAVNEAANAFKAMHGTRRKSELMRGGWGDAQRSNHNGLVGGVTLLLCHRLLEDRQRHTKLYLQEVLKHVTGCVVLMQ